ncbi:lipase member H-like isoform X2 [Sipha flava]|uniref:Lipase member H n=1 Tax=Sipha flava TaxID=143950 RepID=A0A2S2Q035_9HEMI|nr:lipase member H-like isoform X2 [Sipha flava]
MSLLYVILLIFLNIFNVQYSCSNAANINATGIQYKYFDKNYNLMDEMNLKIADNSSLLVFVHGFRSSTHSGMIVNFGKSLARLTDFNVVLVDWSNWTQKMDYTDIVLQLPTVAPYLVSWLNGLKDRGVVNSFDDVTLIGHSLGAQLIGYVGHRLNGTVKRIIALDPAQPNFKASQKNERVDIKSGQFVVVLHTSTSFLGLREPVGHVDFYFNGGQIQPSCSLDTVCGHIVVLDYFIASLKNPNTFTAFQCDTLLDCENQTINEHKPTVAMNMNIPTSTRGLYSVKTEKKDLKVFLCLLVERAALRGEKIPIKT